MSKTLSFKDVTLKFGGITALNSVSFDVKPGELYAIIGPNGAGKTSIFNCISGIYRPTEGEVIYGSNSLVELRPDQVANLGIARTFQNIELFENMTVIDNILFGAHRQLNYGAVSSLFYTKKVRNSEREAREIAEDIIDFLEIQHIRKEPVGNLPYGLQKRVELARALAMEPKLLLLDEPMAGMNVEEKEDMSRFILDVNDQYGTTIALIEHDMSVVMDLADRVVCLDYGKMLADGTAAEVQKNQAVIDAYLGVEH